MVESSVGEDASTDDAIDDVLPETLDMVEFALAAAVSATTTIGLLLASAEAEDPAEVDIASALTAPTLDREANG